MKILIAGGTGFVGNRLVGELVKENHDLILLTRKRNFEGMFRSANIRHVTWDGRPLESLPELPGLIGGCDAVINLSGESIAAGRWTTARRKELVESRVLPTRALVRAMKECPVKPRVLVNASAVGIYGNVDEGDVTEEHEHSEGFLADLCREWEGAACDAAGAGVRVVLLRIGVVLGRGGGALQKMARPFRLFFGGPIGTGRQWFPWIHIDDVTGIIRFVLGTESIKGPVNVAAPEPVRMKEFSRQMGHALGRPSWAPVPGFLLRAVLGEMSGMILGGHRIVPKKLVVAGYRFRFPGLGGALSEIFSGK